MSLGLWISFWAGVASFLSPCVLPLVPGYLSFISGLSLEQLAKSPDRREAARKAGLGSLFFVLGFSLVFTLLGASASAVGRALAGASPLLSKAAGLVIMAFGLHVMGVTPIRWLYYERRVPFSRFQAGRTGAFLMGLAFAFGWTPCIGPVLSGILALAAKQETIGRGMLLLFVYSLGLGLPFVAAAFATESFLSFFARYKRFIRWGEVAAGLLLLGVGALVFGNRMSYLAAWLPRSLFRFAM